MFRPRFQTVLQWGKNNLQHLLLLGVLLGLGGLFVAITQVVANDKKNTAEANAQRLRDQTILLDEVKENQENIKVLLETVEREAEARQILNKEGSLSAIRIEEKIDSIVAKQEVALATLLESRIDSKAAREAVEAAKALNEEQIKTSKRIEAKLDAHIAQHQQP